MNLKRDTKAIMCEDAFYFMNTWYCSIILYSLNKLILSSTTITVTPICSETQSLCLIPGKVNFVKALEKPLSHAHGWVYVDGITLSTLFSRIDYHRYSSRFYIYATFGWYKPKFVSSKGISQSSSSSFATVPANRCVIYEYVSYSFHFWPFIAHHSDKENECLGKNWTETKVFFNGLSFYVIDPVLWVEQLS